MAAAMEGFVQKIVQYPAKEQAELRVRIKIPGKWFPNLTPTEQKVRYEATATTWEPSHRFPKRGERPAMTCEGLRFLCDEDVKEEAAHTCQFHLVMSVSDERAYICTRGN